MSVTTTPSTTQQRQRNPRGEGARLRTEIVTATRSLLADGEQVTLRSVARRASISAPSIYGHFVDIDAVLEAVAEEAFEELNDALTHARESETEPAARLRSLCHAYLGFAAQKPQVYRLMFGGVWNAALALEAKPDEEDHIRQVGMNSFSIVCEAIRDCAAAKVSESVNAEHDAAALWVALHGLAELRESATLFPWPNGIEETLVTRLARLRPGS